MNCRFLTYRLKTEILPIWSTLGSIAFISVGVITAIFLYDLWVGGIDDAADDSNEVDGGASQAHDYCIING